MDDTPMSPDAEPGEIQEPDDVDMRVPAPSTVPAKPKIEVSDEIRVNDGNKRRKHNESAKARSAQKPADKCRQSRLILETFQVLATRGDLNSVYRNRPVYAGCVVNELVDPAIHSYNQVPSTRPAVLNYMGLLVHEATHLFFSRKENPNLPGVDPSSAITAVIRLLKHVEEHMRKDKGNGTAADTLKWICSLSTELAMMNCSRLWARPFIDRGPEGYLEMLQLSETVRRLVTFLNTVFRTLVKKSPETAMTILIDASRGTVHFSWIWLHLASKFPDCIVNHLFTAGAQQFRLYVEAIEQMEKHMTSASSIEALHDEFSSKMTSVADVFNYLTRQHNRELREIARRMITDGLSCELVDNYIPNIQFVFFFKLVTCSVTTLRHLVAITSDLASPLNFFRGVRQLSLMPKQTLLRTLPYLDFVKQMVAALDITSAVRNLFDTLMQIAFDQNVFSAFDKQFPGVCKSLKEGSLLAVNEMVLLLLPLVHSTPQSKMVDIIPLIGECANGIRLQMCVEAAILHPEWAPNLIRFFHVITVSIGADKGGEVVGRLLFTCRDHISLPVLCAFLSTITPFFPKLMNLAYQNLPKYRTMILEERRKKAGFVAMDLRWINNIQILHEWEKNATVNDSIKYVGLNVGSSIGPFLLDTSGWILENLEVMIEIGNVRAVSDLLSSYNRLLSSLAPSSIEMTPPAPPGKIRSILLSPRHMYKLSMQMASLLRCSLGGVTGSAPSSPSEPCSLAVFVDLRSSLIKFYFSQLHHLSASYSTWFMLSFVDGCLQSAADLFGDFTEFHLGAPKNLDMEAEDDNENLYSLWDNVHELGKKRKTEELAHCGIIGKGARNGKVQEVTSDQYTRRHAFLDTVRLLITSNGREGTLACGKMMSLLLVDRLCGDALSGDFSFYDWELEKETISRYLHVTSRVSSSQVIEGLLHIVSDIDPCLWYSLPIIKALMATTMVQFDSSFDKLSRIPSDAMLEKTDRWMVLALKGGVLPSRFSVLSDLLPLCSAHEGLLLLNEVWKYYQKKSGLNVANALFASAKRGEMVKINDHCRDAQEMMIAVLQRDMEKRGHLFPLIFEENTETDDNEIAEPDE